MKHLFILVLCVWSAACVGQRRSDYNLDFENLNQTTGLPKGWGLGNVSVATVPNDSSITAYRIDSVAKLSGKYSLLIDWTKRYKPWTATNYVIKQVFKGDRIKLTGYVKTEKAMGSAGLWMRLDGEKYKNYGFDNMQDRPITGTTDWQEYTIEMDYDEDRVKQIVVGGLITGPGKMWMDNLRVTVNDVDISEAPLNLYPPADPGPAPSKYITDDSVKITMRDGAQVSAIIVRKRSAVEPLPDVLMCDIYPGESNEMLAKYCAEKGYVGIIADTRGKRLSNVNVEPFEHDANDAYDVIEWISKQKWCNGKVGMYGGSYLGFSQWAAAKKVHPALKTIVPQVAVAPGIDFPTQCGIPTCYSLKWLHYVMNNKLTDYEDFSNRTKWEKVYKDWYVSGRPFSALDTIEGRPNKIFHRWLQHPAYDKYWQHMVPYESEFAGIRIPVLTITGYWDDDQRGAMYYFNQHQLYNKENDDYLLIGPYDHFGAQRYPQPVVQGYTIDSVARINIMQLVFQWFDYTLKGGAKPSLLKDKINYEVTGANEWKHAPSLAAIINDTLTFYLGSAHAGNGYRLNTIPETGGPGIRQEIDLADRSDSDTNDEGLILRDTLISDTVADKRNYIVFTSDTLRQQLTVNGSFISNLSAIINKKDMDIAIELYEQLPNGKYLLLSGNMARCSYIKDQSKRQLLTPGKTENLLFSNTFFTSRRLSIGSRVVLVIGVNKGKSCEVNYGTGGDVSRETIKDAKEPLVINWITDSSYIKLPVLK